MSLQASVEVTGIDGAVNELNDLPEKIEGAITAKMQAAVLKGANVAKKRLTQKQSGYSEGLLRASIRPFVTIDKMVAGVRAGGAKTSENGFDYARAVEFGTRPHFPPVKALTGQQESLDTWVRRMSPSAPEGMEDASQEEVNETVAFLIARDISRTGTKEMPFMRPGFNVARAKLRKSLRNLDDEISR